MPGRDIDQELDILVKELKLSKKEAYETLGLNPKNGSVQSSATSEKFRSNVENRADGSRLSLEREASNSEVASNQSSREAITNELILQEMFPEIALEDIQSVLAENNFDVDKSTELLLNWGVLDEEKNSEVSTKESKLSKKNRKLQRRQKRAVDSEENDIAVITSTLKISAEEARALYWTNQNDLSKVLLLHAPKQPLGIRTPAVPAVAPLASSNTPSRFLAPVEIDDYSTMPRRALLAEIEDTKKRINTLQPKILTNSNKHWDRIRASDIAADVQSLKAELRLMELALHKSEKLAPNNARNAPHDRLYRLDLHGCTLDQAKVIVSEAIQQFQSSSRSHLEIITGAGRHSERGRAVLKTWLRTYLKQANIRTEELDGSFVISQKVRV